jgi:hypothetical protein
MSSFLGMTDDEVKRCGAALAEAEATKGRPIDPIAFFAGWQAARAHPAPANELEADAMAWRTLVAHADGAHVHQVGHVTYADKSPTFDEPVLGFGASGTLTVRQEPILRAAFQWINTGDCPTLRDGLLALAKRED